MTITQHALLTLHVLRQDKPRPWSDIDIAWCRCVARWLMVMHPW